MRKTIIACLAGLGLMFVNGAAEAKTYNTVSNLSQMQVQGQMALKIFEDIAAMTEGRIQLKWHDSGDLIPVNMHLNAVSSGSVPGAFTAFAYFGGTLPIANIYAGFPFSPDADEWAQWLFMGDGLKILQETLDPLNIVAVPVMATSPEAGGFFKKEINTPADFDGLRFRIGGWGGEVVSRLGAVVSQIPANELYLAMDRGRIDALEFANPANNATWGFDKLAKYYYFPGWHQPVGLEWLLINKKVWESWSEEDRAAVMDVCRAAFSANDLTLEMQDAQSLADLNGADIQLRRFPDEVLAALRAAWGEVLKDGMAKHPEVKKAYESFMEYTGRKTQLRELQDMSDVQGG